MCGEIDKIPVYHFLKNEDNERESAMDKMLLTILLFVNNIGLQMLIS